MSHRPHCLKHCALRRIGKKLAELRVQLPHGGAGESQAAQLVISTPAADHAVHVHDNVRTILEPDLRMRVGYVCLVRPIPDIT